MNISARFHDHYLIDDIKEVRDICILICSWK
jgi:hypothetical protein